MSTIFDNFNGTVDLKVFKKNNPDPKTPLRRHYLSLVGLLQYVDIMNGDAEGSLPAGWNENTIAGMLNHCIGDLDTRIAAISPSPAPVTKNYFYVENISNEPATFTITRKGASVPFDSIEISDDKENWTELILNNDIYTFDIQATSKVYMRAEQSSWNGWNISSTQFNVGGNIMSLLYGSNFEYKETLETADVFNGIFQRSNVVNASSLMLPATELSENCYKYMFYRSSLVSAPSLPATTLAQGCYNNMFAYTEIETAPQLPAQILSPGCYWAMFYGCTNLEQAPILSSMELSTNCYTAMFYGCTSLVTAPALPATSLADYCYMSMFNSCTSLVNAPELPSRYLFRSCYASMFSGCTSLIESPVLPATSLLNHCYGSMFSGCTNLNKVTTYAETGTDAGSATGGNTYNWLDNVAQNGTFYNLGRATYEQDSTSGIPEGWTVSPNPLQE